MTENTKSYSIEDLRKVAGPYITNVLLGIYRKDVSKVLEFVNTPKRYFDGKTPVQMCGTEAGAAHVRRVVRALEKGVATGV